MGSTNRDRQLLLCLKEVVQSYSHKSGSYSQALLVLINHVISRIQEARPISTSMGNAVKSLKTHLAVLSQGEKLKEARDDAEMMTVEAQKEENARTSRRYFERIRRKSGRDDRQNTFDLLRGEASSTRGDVWTF